LLIALDLQIMESTAFSFESYILKLVVVFVFVSNLEFGIPNFEFGISILPGFQGTYFKLGCAQ